MRVRRPLSRHGSKTGAALRSRPGDERNHELAEPDQRERRVRQSGGPQDLAHYACDCGYQFTASVATAVRCPHCGSEQAW